MPMGRKMSLRSAMGAMWKSLLQKVYCFVDVHFLRALLRGLTFSDFAAWPYVIVVVPGARFSSRVATPRRPLHPWSTDLGGSRSVGCPIE